jgi:Tol biopolymer transport system component/predicted Ser/Thr protein kinase
MTLSAGTRLGPYEVLSPLGAGGMGEVYRARDTRLEREVAIKVLPAEVASETERLKRFEKEARSASALNHPNIVTIHDIGSEGGVSYIAMERVEGTTLRELLVGGPLPVKKLLQIAPQIAEGLSKAHEAGILHRDLKPENVMVTRDGHVKILDFGLAKLTSRTSGSGEGSQLPTMTGTTPGVVMGTVSYMSPEQAGGEALDFRSDQFSFGSILYELVTGKRAFQKKTAVDTLAAILNEEPEPIGEISPHAPPPLRWIIERCLSKDPEGRYASTKDLARELRTVSDHISEATLSGGTSARVVPARRRVLLVPATVGLLALGVFGGRFLWKTKAAASPRFIQVTSQKVNINTAAFAPDGQTIVYSSRRAAGRLELFQTRPGSRGSRPMGIFGGLITSISASGEMALIQETDAGRFLTVAPIGGGEPRQLLPDPVAWADWAPDGKSLAILRGEGTGIPGRLEFPIGNLLYEPASGRIRVSPQGDRVAFTTGRRLAVVDRKKVMKVLSEDVSGMTEFDWSPDGAEIWFSRITGGATHLFAVTLAGRERPLVSLPGDFTLYDVSREGRVLLERVFEQWHVVGRFPGDEREHGYNWLDMTVANDLSPDGKTLLFMEKDPLWTATSYIRKTDGSAAVPFAEGICSALSPDGKWVVCRSEPSAPSVRLVSTSGESRDLPNAGLELKSGAGRRDWLPDGKRFVFNAAAPGRPSRIYVQSIDGSPPVPVTPEGVELVRGGNQVSPDGRFVIAIHEGPAALYPLAGGSPIPIRGLLDGDLPMQWSSDGRSLYLRRDDAPGKIWLLDLANGRRRLFKELQPPDPWLASGRGWLFNLFITPDGQYYAATYNDFLADLFVLDGLK